MRAENGPVPVGPSAREATSWLIDQALGFVFPAALRAVAVLGVADRLAGGPLPVAELAERAGVHEGNVLRVLRVLATRGVVEELDDGRFRLTELGQPLRSDAPLPAGPAILMLTDRSLWQPCGELEACLRQGGPVFDELFGMPFFQYFAQEERTATAFHNGMAAFSDQENEPIAAAYDFPEAGTVVDIGGGRGGFLLEVLRRRPGLHGVLLDEPHVVTDHRLDVDEVKGRWEVTPGDFFTEVPTADVHMLKRILHDWDDERCVDILRTSRRSLAPGGRVLVIDAVIPSGNAPHQAKALDVLLMAAFPGRERTRAEFERLFAAAGLALSRIVPTGTVVSVVEARLG
ncbi:hydroxyneurosporene methyltransferase [Actinomadura barringtoniae]|uniref:Hydroxyneurosporene methyltransferase n=1 Tax=Actinomadura barringtoniae TaxID=1427535 RepID=A0A939PJH9_9ACTN|nr:methyltransferase [Actinomadura barringtoniae]MBO2449716.1 hydroxyneurosporene methyltransferase [Actinomadura barringtoniae]